MTTLIAQLAAAKGISDHYTTTWGAPVQVSESSKAAMLGAMGYNVADEAALNFQLEQETRRHWLSPLDPVIVADSGQALSLELRLPLELANDTFTWQFFAEGDTEASQQGQLTAVDGELIDVAEFADLECHCYRLALPLTAPLGYHRLQLSDDSSPEPLASTQLIITPSTCYKPAAIAAGKKVWGPSVQLYCLRSKHNWGIGDFTDLTQLVSHIAAWGADFVGLNPIHALYPANPESASPYSPSSRRWLNVAYIDVTQVPEYLANAELVADVREPLFQAKLAALRALTHVDYQGVVSTKLAILRRAFMAAPLTAPRQQAFAAFVAAGGDSLTQQAAFDALQAHFYHQGDNAWGWPVWPNPFQHYDNDAVQQWIAQHPQEINFYRYLQFVADEQLMAVDAAAKAAGMTLGIYRDLAVGVSEGSSEIWAHHDLYCPQASIGAPPDILGPKGQNWGLPPMNPAKLYQAAFAPFIDLLRANMRGAGALRIDHVMALLRLWWVPPGAPASAGAYVHYPVDELLAILALESVRQQCLVIGEDLGTVPEGMDVLLRDRGVHSYKVFFFERSKDDGGFISPAHYATQAMSALTTHDMPTLRGFWHCDDLALGQQLGLYSDAAQLEQLYHDRHQAKQRILDSLHGHGVVDERVSRDAHWAPMDQALSFALQRHLASGSCALFSTQLEDWLAMDKPVNVPGTSHEYPNWRRKLSCDLDDLFASEHLAALAQAMSAARRAASQHA
ncbi:MAG: 4-alpha-glucanotransferase [Aeromonas sp.]